MISEKHPLLRSISEFRAKLTAELLEKSKGDRLLAERDDDEISNFGNVMFQDISNGDVTIEKALSLVLYCEQSKRGWLGKRLPDDFRGKKEIFSALENYFEKPHQYVTLSYDEFLKDLNDHMLQRAQLRRNWYFEGLVQRAKGMTIDPVRALYKDIKRFVEITLYS